MCIVIFNIKIKYKFATGVIFFSIWSYIVRNVFIIIVMPPLKKEGYIALHLSVRLSVGPLVSLNLVQLITQEGFAPEASNLVGR